MLMPRVPTPGVLHSPGKRTSNVEAVPLDMDEPTHMTLVDCRFDSHELRRVTAPVRRRALELGNLARTPVYWNAEDCDAEEA